MSAARRAILAAALALGAVAATSRPAGAVPRFPEDIARHEQLDYTPPCRLCHIQGTTGAGSVQTPFGVSMLAHGLTEDVNNLDAALDALAADGIDSDGDGVPDITELKNDTDPNTPADVPLSSSEPQYGCATAPATRAPTALLPVAIALAGALTRARRRRRGRDR